MKLKKLQMMNSEAFTGNLHKTRSPSAGTVTSSDSTTLLETRDSNYSDDEAIVESTYHVVS